MLGLAADASYTAVVTNGRLVITGKASDQLALRLQSGVPTTLQVDVGNDGTANFSFDRGLFDRIVVNAGGGDDTVSIDQANGAFTDPAAADGETTTINGGSGNDTLGGGAGAQTANGGAGNDTLEGNPGDDRALGDDGNDTFVWDPGDGSDVIRSGDGSDLLVFHGNGANEVMQIGTDGPRLSLFRNVANVTMDVDGLELVALDALGGADIVTVDSLKPTDVTRVTIDLEGSLGGGSGDAQVDVVQVNTTAGAETVNVGASGAATVASGLKATVAVLRAEAANDRLVLNTCAADRVNVNGTGAGDSLAVAPSPSGGARVTTPLLTGPADVVGGTLTLKGMDGDDTLTGSGNLAALGVVFRYEGGPGNDQLGGGNAADRLLGGPGNDALDGNQGDDRAFGQAGNDTFVWDPGDASDVLEGGSGTADRLVFNGNGAAEAIELSANGPRLRFFRNVANVTLDVADVERVIHRALGGADTILVRNLKRTDVRLVTLELEGTPGGGAGDGQADAVTVHGTAERDLIHVAAVGGAAEVSGLRARVRILHPDAALDHLTVNGLGGTDRITVGSGLPALIALTVNQ